MLNPSVPPGFLELRPYMFSAGDSFEVSFEFKTDQLNALLLFASDTEGDDYILVTHRLSVCLSISLSVY